MSPVGRVLRALLAAVWVAHHVVTSVDHPEDFVNLLAGTFTDGNIFSTGNTLPLVGRPWGFSHWAPSTREGNRNAGSWWFRGNDHVFTWLRCTHQPSPWIGDWGWFVFGAQVGNNGNRNPVFYWEPRGAVIKPHLFDATFSPLGVRMELTPTMHGAMLRATFPSNAAMGHGEDTERRVCFAEAQEWAAGVTADQVPYLTGKALQVKQDRMIVSNFARHIRAESESAMAEVEINGDLACFRYKADTAVVTVRIATSLISHEQAEVSLRRELPLSRGFNDLAAEARAEWNQLLRRVDVVDPGRPVVSADHARHLTVFYTGLARALSFPRRLDEVDKNGRTVHYSPYDPSGRRDFTGPLVTDNGFWDTFRTVYPLLSLLYPDHLGTIIQGWLNAYKEGGWLPSWASPGYRNCMVGTYADVVIADAIVRGIKGFDVAMARDALRKDAFQEPPPFAGGSVGKDGLARYRDKGYFETVAGQGGWGGDQVSRTLDFGFADYAAARAFATLAGKGEEETKGMYTEFSGETDRLWEDAKTLNARAKRALTSMFDKGKGLMVPKGPDGAAVNDGRNFKDIEWGFGFVEGNAWHHSFPPYLIEELAALHGGKAALLKKLKRLLAMPSDFQVGSYGQEIHEMTEARAFGMGQYSHNNQPVHHILYLFALLGDRTTTETAVRQVMERGYGTDFYAGDEDNGEQGAWYVLSALGLFSAVPGSADLVLGSPLFRHVRVWRGVCAGATTPPALPQCDYTLPPPLSTPKGEPHNPAGPAADHVATFPQGSAFLDIVALGTGPAVTKVVSVTFNGVPVSSDSHAATQGHASRGAVDKAALVKESLLHRDGVLRFVMDGERIHNVLPPFSRDQLTVPGAEAAHGLLPPPGSVIAGAAAGGSGSGSGGNVKAAEKPSPPVVPPAMHPDSISDADPAPAGAVAPAVSGGGGVGGGGAGVAISSSQVVNTVSVTNHGVRRVGSRWLALWEFAALLLLLAFVGAAAYGMVRCFEAVGVVEPSTKDASGNPGSAVKRKHKAPPPAP